MAAYGEKPARLLCGEEISINNGGTWRKGVMLARWRNLGGAKYNVGGLGSENSEAISSRRLKAAISAARKWHQCVNAKRKAALRHRGARSWPRHHGMRVASRGGAQLNNPACASGNIETRREAWRLIRREM